MPAWSTGNSMLGRKTQKLDHGLAPSGTELRLSGRPVDDQYELTLEVADEELTAKFPKRAIIGNVALVNNFDPGIKNGRGSRYRFSHWSVGGEAFTSNPGQKFGPILWSMYSLSDSRGQEGFVMKISALTGPLGKRRQPIG